MCTTTTCITALLLLLCGAASAFTVTGNKLYDGNNKPVLLRGIARPSFEWSVSGEQATLADYTHMKNWGANVVRIGMSQCFWLESSTSTTYKANILQQVNWVKSLGMAVILDLHWSNKNAASGGCGQQVMADGNSLTFWAQVAAAYKDDPMILFELYNEPHDVPWSVWLNGGDAGAGFTVVGMQQLYNTVRAAGAANVVIVGGLNYAYDLTGLPTYALTGSNIMYCTHPYDFGGKQPGDWPTSFGFLATNYALIATEFGEFKCDPTFNRNFVAYANLISMSWTAWGWYVKDCAFPSLISDWSGTPAATAVPVQCDLMYTQKIPGNTTGGSICDSGGTVTTGSANTGGSGTGVNVTLYADSVQVYTDYTWATTKNPSDSTNKHSGSYSYSWVPSNFNAMYFYSAGAVSTTKFRGLEFWVHGGTTGNQNIRFNIVQGNPATKIGPDQAISVYTGSAVTTSWRRGFVDFSSFPAGNYDGVWFQSSSSSTEGTIYFDDVVLVAYPPATTSAGSVTTSSKSSSSTATAATTTTSSASSTAIATASTSVVSVTASSATAASTSSSSKSASTSASGASATSAATSTATSAQTTATRNCTVAAVGCPCSATIACESGLFCVTGSCQADSAIVDSHASAIKYSLLFVLVSVGALLLL